MYAVTLLYVATANSRGALMEGVRMNFAGISCEGVG